MVDKVEGAHVFDFLVHLAEKRGGHAKVVGGGGGVGVVGVDERGVAEAVHVLCDCGWVVVVGLD